MKKMRMNGMGLFVCLLLLVGTGAEGRPGKMRGNNEWFFGKRDVSAWEVKDLFIVRKPFVFGSWEPDLEPTPFKGGHRIQLREGDLIWNVSGPLKRHVTFPGCPLYDWEKAKDPKDRCNISDAFDLFLWTGEYDDEHNPIPNWTYAGCFAETNGMEIGKNPYIDVGDYVEYLGRRNEPTIDKPKDARVLSVLRKRLRK